MTAFFDEEGGAPMSDAPMGGDMGGDAPAPMGGEEGGDAPEGGDDMGGDMPM